eukprot:CAMPEP_0184645396 /NCGR_PEP_ID=MMETSP0308-20130426/1854_1 /TAXON_ID=38269 /ORGANISM="Gloeochaete witrockiana, Strain SAG 46.84" /LENGTH=806 /DNA_ID=CAMNT_0027074327 /DNA_START=255 /DNA_END=2675 /DNA_ORIENTATION=-
MAKVTDALIRCLNLARDNQDYLPAFHEIRARHHATILDLLGEQSAAATAVFNELQKDCKDIEDLLRAVYLGRAYSERMMELVSGYGEVWSARMLGTYLQAIVGLKASWLDARQALVVEDSESGVLVLWPQSEENMRKVLAESGSDLEYLVITGYVARTVEGIPCTLKRNGSDYSGSIFGNLLNADSIIIWTDVDGVYTADPRKVPEAMMVDEMSYNEAAELAYFGAKVIHPHTMIPAIAKKIPIYIRNTFNSSCPGTKIWSSPYATSNGPITPAMAVKGFSAMEGAALINVEGTGMIGVPGCAQRVFGSLKEVGISVILIAQSSSEHSICFAIPESSGELAKETLEKAFFREIHHNLISAIELTVGCAIVAVVGDRMSHTTGIAAKFFEALGKNKVNVRAIAQGSNERNISAVIDRKDAARALRAAHSRLFLTGTVLSVGVIGAGLIGGALLAQLEAQASELKKKYEVDVRVRGILDLGKMVIDDTSVFSKGGWKARFDAADVPAGDINSFVDHLHSTAVIAANTVIVDCTASQFIADQYPGWLARGIHVVTPNKKAFSGPYELYEKIQQCRRDGHSYVGMECTVGAALPVLGPLRDLNLNGDRIKRVEGVLSGTLSFIFNTFSSVTPSTPQPFSAIVREAKERGYTEPDPRDDLSGLDVARKVTILARESRMKLEVSDLNVYSLVPEELRDTKSITPAQFLDGLTKFDQQMAKVLSDAQSSGSVLRYVGIVDVENGKASVEMKQYPASHPLATLAGADNMIAFTTERYTAQQPLVIRGPGAGAAVTAGGVFADILKIASSIGAIF